MLLKVWWMALVILIFYLLEVGYGLAYIQRGNKGNLGISPLPFRWGAWMTEDGEWGNSGNVKKRKGALMVETPGDNIFHSLAHHGVDVSQQNWVLFKVKACTDAYLALMDQEQCTQSAYKVVLGGSGNSESAFGVQRPEVTYSGRLLSCRKYKKFWITWFNRKITIGAGPIENQQIIMSWEDPNPRPIQYIAVSTGTGVMGNWMFFINMLGSESGQSAWPHGRKAGKYRGLNPFRWRWGSLQLDDINLGNNPWDSGKKTPGPGLYPWIPGQHSWMPRKQKPGNGRLPWMPGQHPWMPRKQKPGGHSWMSGKQPWRPSNNRPGKGQNPWMPRKQMPGNGRHPWMPGQHPWNPRKQKPGNGRHPWMPGQHPWMPRKQKPGNGQHPWMPRKQKPGNGRHPWMPGQHPWMPRKQKPGNGRHPWMPGQHPWMPRKQKPGNGRHPLTPGQHPWMPRKKKPGNGRHPWMPGQHPWMPRKQKPGNGRNPWMSGQHPWMPRKQKPGNGQHPWMPRKQKPGNGQHPWMPRKQKPGNGQHPWMPRKQKPGNGRHPWMPGRQPWMPGKQPWRPGKNKPGQGLHPWMPGKQKPGNGRNPWMPGKQPWRPGQHPWMPGKQKPGNGRNPWMPGQLPWMPGKQKPGNGRHPWMPGRHPLMPGKQPWNQGNNRPGIGKQPWRPENDRHPWVPGTCIGRCGQGYNNTDSCHCNWACQKHKDCCADYQLLCSDRYPWMPGKQMPGQGYLPWVPGTCIGRCGQGYNKADSCHCNWACQKHKDCCADYHLLCSGQHPWMPGKQKPGQGTCSGRCGSKYSEADDCQCDWACASFKDCCADHQQLCQGQHPWLPKITHKKGQHPGLPEIKHKTGTCSGRCGSRYSEADDCQCDWACASFKDCCSDHQQLCQGRNPWIPKTKHTKGTCKGRCGSKYREADDCQCDWACASFKDCCADHQRLCHGPNSGIPKTKHTKGTCSGRCGSKYREADDCQCDWACASFEDCCADHQQVCQGSCFGKCNAVFNPSRPCQCDKQCGQYGNCCEDYESICKLPDNGQSQPGKSKDRDSCIGKCNTVFNPSRPCQCNRQCGYFSDCCKDYKDICVRRGERQTPHIPHKNTNEKCNIVKRVDKTCHVRYSLSGECHFVSRARKQCRYTVDMSSRYTARVTIRNKTLLLRSGVRFVGCATFMMYKSWLTIADKLCPAKCQHKGSKRRPIIRNRRRRS